jgi:uncharacterized protein YndB with AHSA1/START domain
MKSDMQPIVVEQSFATAVGDLWRAITDVEWMRQWFFEGIPDFRPEVGFRTEFSVRSGERDFLHLWMVTEVEPLKRIVYDWRYDGYPGDSFVEFKIFERDGRATLRLTHSVREDFPDDISDFSRESCEGGWEYFIKQQLRSFLEGA